MYQDVYLQKTPNWGEGGKMPKDMKLYESVAMYCADLDLPYYPKLLLVNMVYRNIRHPEEKMDVIMNKIMKSTVPTFFQKHKRKEFMHISVKREMEMLERELHECSNIPDKLLNGKVISNTVNYYAERFRDEP